MDLLENIFGKLINNKCKYFLYLQNLNLNLIFFN